MADPRWKEKLRKASFRGVSFFVDSHGLSGGRRGVQHEYAQRDVPFTEDTGRKGRKYSVEAYVLGDDYMVVRDQLIAACEEFGPGELIHPYLGRQVVNCFDFSVKETNRDGGMAVFTLALVESGQELFPDSKVDPVSSVMGVADLVKQAKLQEFIDRFSVAKMPQFVLDSATEKVRSISDALSNAQDRSGSFLGASALAAAEIGLLRSNAGELIQDPEKLFSSIQRSFSLLFDSVTNKRSGYEAAGSLVSFGQGDTPISGSTTTRDIQRQNQSELNSATRIIAISDAAIEAVQVEFESTRDAEDIRGFLLGAIDEECMRGDVSDDLFDRLRDLRVEIVRGVPGDAERLSVVSSFTPNETIPSLVAAYDVYGSVERELDVVSRNKIEHPGFIVGGNPIEILLGEDGQ